MDIEKIKAKMQEITDSTEGWDIGELQVTITPRGIGSWTVWKNPTHQGGVKQMVATGSGEPLLQRIAELESAVSELHDAKYEHAALFAGKSITDLDYYQPHPLLIKEGE